MPTVLNKTLTIHGISSTLIYMVYYIAKKYSRALLDMASIVSDSKNELQIEASPTMQGIGNQRFLHGLFV